MDKTPVGKRLMLSAREHACLLRKIKCSRHSSAIQIGWSPGSQRFVERRNGRRTTKLRRTPHSHPSTHCGRSRYGEKEVISTGPEPLKATVAAAAAAAAVGGGARGAKRVTLTFAPGTLGPAGLLLRLTGAVRQTCPLGEKQVTGNPTSDPVPASQCGCASGFEIGTDADGMFHTQRIDATCLALHACQGGFCCSAGEGR